MLINHLILIFCLFFPLHVFSLSTLDLKLLGYVKSFQLKSITPPGPREEKLFKLGKKLFFEKALSGNNNISCADCHHPKTMSGDGLPLSLGEGARGLELTRGGRVQEEGEIIPRHSPPLFNLHGVHVMFWDGRVQFNPKTGEFLTPIKLPSDFTSVLKNALSAQALFPLLSHEEMRGKKGTNEIATAETPEKAWELLFKRIISIEFYRKKLQEIFGREKLTIAHVARAIGHFEEHEFFSEDTNYDRFLKGDLSSLSDLEKKGMDVFFGKGQCGSCHQGEHLSGFGFQNIGVPQIGPGVLEGDDLGRFHLHPEKKNLYAFRVPPLRNVGVTAPYMHNGSLSTLEEVIEHYDDIERGLTEYEFAGDFPNYRQRLPGPITQTHGVKLSSLSSKLVKKLFFTEEEESALLEFLSRSLTERRFLKEIKYQDKKIKERRG